MDIGVVLQTTPPSARVIDLAKRAETYGFSHVWTFDSPHPVGGAVPDLHADPGDTRNVMVGPMVTNPLTRDWTVTASAVRHAERDVRQPHRDRDRPRRLGGPRDQRQALHAGRAPRGDPRDPRAGERTRGGVPRLDAPLPWASKSRAEVWGAGYGPKALQLIGEVADGFILQLADPDITAWTIAAVRKAASDAGRDPAESRSASPRPPT